MLLEMVAHETELSSAAANMRILAFNTGAKIVKRIQPEAPG